MLSGQQIRSKIDSFQNFNFLISQPNPIMLLIGIVSERETIPLSGNIIGFGDCYHSLELSRRDDFNEGNIIGFG